VQKITNGKIKAIPVIGHGGLEINIKKTKLCHNQNTGKIIV
jgi:hypothetical protein